MEELEKKRQTRKMLELVPAVLNERERFIVSQRYGLYDKKPMTQREIAAALGISRSYVSRIEKRALEKLRKNFQDEKNQSFL